MQLEGRAEKQSSSTVLNLWQKHCYWYKQSNCNKCVNTKYKNYLQLNKPRVGQLNTHMHAHVQNYKIRSCLHNKGTTTWSIRLQPIAQVKSFQIFTPRDCSADSFKLITKSYLSKCSRGCSPSYKQFLLLRETLDWIRIVKHR